MSVQMQHRSKTWCNVFQFVRKDGVVVGLTDHNRVIDWEGTTYSPIGLASQTSERRTVGLQESAMELVGYLDGAITADDLRARRYNGALLRHRVICWRTGRMHYAATRWVQQMVTDGSRWHAALTGRTNQLQEPHGGRFGGSFSVACRYRLGSDHCKAAVVPVTGDDYTGVVLSAGVDYLTVSSALFPSGDTLQGASIYIRPRRGSATVTIAAGNAADTNTVTVIDTIGTTVVFEFDSGGGVTSGRTAVTIGATNALSATALAAAINAHTTLQVVAEAASGVVTMTQQNGGTAGNTTVTVSGANLSKTNFSGGAASTGEGQERKVLTCTSTTFLYVQEPWDTIPAASSPFSVGFGATVSVVNDANTDCEFGAATVPEWFRQNKLGFDDWFRLGEAEWTTGDNAGIVSPILTYVHGTRRVELTFPTPFPIVVGDRAILRPGCDGLRGTCMAKFAGKETPTVMGNMKNHGGSPFDEAGGEVLEPPSGEPMR